jgi:hypothetical protein
MTRLSEREGVPLLDGGDDDPEQIAVKERGR